MNSINKHTNAGTINVRRCAAVIATSVGGVESRWGLGVKTSLSPLTLP